MVNETSRRTGRTEYASSQAKRFVHRSRPDPPGTRSGYVDALLAHPSVYGAFHRVMSRGKLDRLREVLRDEFHGRPAALKILDLGSGPGTNVRIFLADARYEYLGIDINRRYVDYANRRFGTMFQQGDITSLAGITDRFDIILLNSVLHHLDDQAARTVLAGSALHLAVGGRFVVIDMILPSDLSWRSWPARSMIRLDRGAFCRTAGEIESLLGLHFRRWRSRSFALPSSRVRLWEMRVYVCIDSLSR